jgi:hypothetical protein
MEVALIVTGDETVLPGVGLETFTWTVAAKAEPQKHTSANRRLNFFKITPWIFGLGLVPGLDEGRGLVVREWIRATTAIQKHFERLLLSPHVASV